MSAYLYLILAVGTILWCVPFARALASGTSPFRIDKRARWGVALECLSYSLLWQGHFWETSPAAWRVALSIILMALACTLSWTAAHALGRHLRIDAAVDASHTLVRSGPYRLVRHPIYTSMLCVLLATGVLVAPVYLLLPAVLIFIAGTEIRTRIEDRLLAAQFGERFNAYQRDVPGWIPFLIR